jgi:hypothetical protein
MDQCGDQHLRQPGRHSWTYVRRDDDTFLALSPAGSHTRLWHRRLHKPVHVANVTSALLLAVAHGHAAP